MTELQLNRVNRSQKQFFMLCILTCVCSLIWWVTVSSNEGEEEMIRGSAINLSSCVVGPFVKNDNGLSRNLTVAISKADSAVNLGNVTNSFKNETKVIILMWTKYYEIKGETLMKLIFTGRSRDPTCCEGLEVTLDRGRIEEATGVVFFHYVGNLKKGDLPKKRKPEQLWILFSKESPYLSNDLRPYNNLFNWTMSYRRDSEIWAPYGEYFPLKNEVKELKISGQDLTSWISGKTKLMVGVISHCRTASKRENYIKLLRSVGNISIDIYGACGAHICPRRNHNCNHSAFWEDLGRKYKFYFAAENSLCSEYITEKFWRPLQLGMVPVAFGKGNYSAVAPPGSFIDTKDFSSPKELVNYLKKLDEDPEEYRKYFEWRKHFAVRKDESWQAWCDLCKNVKEFRWRLDQDSSQLLKLSHVYTDLGKWWSRAPDFLPNEMGSKINVEGACSKPNFLRKPK